MKKVICLLGPTASGKTDTALFVADQLPVEIISVDSALIYKGMDIGTAKPSPQILANYPHHLIDILEPTERYSAASFAKEAMEKIEACFAANKTPLLVGGTFLYFKALLEGFAEMPESTDESKAFANQMLQEKGNIQLYQMLQVIDPESASRLHVHDTQRVLRALEVFWLSGKKMSEFWQTQETHLFPYPVLKLTLLPAVVERFNIKMATRFDVMLEQGLVDEVKGLQEKYPELTSEYPSQRAVGYRQVWEYLSGEVEFDLMREKAIIATRQYAKRQRTWLRSEENITPLYVHDDAPPFEAAWREIESFLSS